MESIKIAAPRMIPYEDLVKSDEDRTDMLCFYYEHIHMHYEDLFRWIIFSAPRLEREYVEEIHQETILRALEHRHQLRDIEKCKTWLFSIGKNAIAEHYRDMMKRERLTLAEEVSDLLDVVPEDVLKIDVTVEEVLRRSNSKILMECLNQLSKEQKIVIVRHHFNDESFEEISKSLHRNYNTVYSWYRRGLARMRRLILKKGGFDHE
ncbi:MAG: RNA polymerase sigma factor [Firmicutes bacterium]|nr:RNA polymerase sigma factor [Bacillota bacterium]